MLKSKTDYKYIREKMFGAEGASRVTIDINVIGTRSQKRINRNVDYFYLKEIDTLYNTEDLQQSVEFDYPISISNKLISPKTDRYADKDKLAKINVDSEDIFKYSDNEDPDYDALRERLANATDTYQKNVQTALTTKNDTISNLKQQYDNDILSYSKQTAALTAQLPGIESEYQNKITANDEQYGQNLDALRKRIAEIDKQYENNEIDIAAWNTQRSQLEDEWYDACKDHFAGAEDAYIWLSGQKSSIMAQKFEIYVNQLNTTKKYDEDVAKANETYSSTVSQEQKNLNKTSQEIWTQSNGIVGSTYCENLQNVRDSIAALNIYPAYQHVDKAIPWIQKGTEDTYIEYNNRLFAVWEKCTCLKADIQLSRDVAAAMEHYSSSETFPSITDDHTGVTYPGHTATSDFKRLQYGDFLSFEREYKNDGEGASQSSTYSVDDTTYSVRFGNRHQSGHVDKITLVLQIEGSGEDGHGYKYALVDATFDKAIAADWLSKFDTAEDEHQIAIQKIDDKYAEDSQDLKFSLDSDLADLQFAYEKSLRDLEWEYVQEKQSTTMSWISGIDTTMQQANALKAEGKDNSSLLQQIRDSKTQYNEQIARLQQTFDQKRLDLSNKLSEDKTNRQQKYSDDLNTLTNKKNTDINEENSLYANKLEDLRNKYADNISQAEQSLQDEYDKTMKNAAEERDSVYKANEERTNALNKSLANLWNQKCDSEGWGDDYKVSEEYNFAGGPPSTPAAGTLEFDKWYAQNFSLPLYNLQIQNDQAIDAAMDTYNTTQAEAKYTQLQKSSQIERMDLRNRDRFTFSGGQFSGFASNFSKTSSSGYGERYCGRVGVIAAFAIMKYGAETEGKYPDYETIDDKTTQ